MAYSSHESIIGRSALSELLHALNQPLTGLQCSLEVTLAVARTKQHYQRTLRDGLQLTERMRLLVEALREVAESLEDRHTAGQKPPPEANAAGLHGEVWDLWCEAVRDAVGDLLPVAEMRQITIALNPRPDPARSSRCPMQMVRSVCGQGVLRLLDAVVALAADGSVVKVELDTPPKVSGFCVRWRARVEAEKDHAALSRPELGLLVARTRLEQFGAEWQRQRTADGEGEVVSVQFSAARAAWKQP
jgi:hypothetical protein